MRTQSMGRPMYAASQEHLNQKGTFSEFEAIHKPQLAKTISSNPRIDCGPPSLWSSNIPPAGIDNQQIQSSQQQQPWSQMTTPPHMRLDTSLPPPPPRTPWTVPDNIPSDQPKQLDSLLENNSHRKITRQLTLNPTFDPRIPLSYQQLNINHSLISCF